jgi:hypothetical protein
MNAVTQVSQQKTQVSKNFSKNLLCLNIFSGNDKNIMECTLATNVLETSVQIYINSQQSSRVESLIQ